MTFAADLDGDLIDGSYTYSHVSCWFIVRHYNRHNGQVHDGGGRPTNCDNDFIERSQLTIPRALLQHFGFDYLKLGFDTVRDFHRNISVSVK